MFLISNTPHPHTALVACMRGCIVDLKSAADKLSTGSAISLSASWSKSFGRQVKQALESVWQKVSYSTRQLIADVSVIRTLMDALYSVDSITFLRMLDTVRRANQQRRTKSLWLMTPEAENLISAAANRVYTLDHGAKK